MNLNLNVLYEAVKCLPDISQLNKRNRVQVIKVYSRLDHLNLTTEEISKCDKPAKTHSMVYLTFEAIKYSSENGTWYEWELKL